MVGLQILLSMFLPIKFRYFISAVLILFVSCNSEDSWDCFKTAGKVQIEYRDLEDFDKVSIFDKVEVELIQSDKNGIEIRAGKNLISGVVSKIEGDRLVIQNQNKCELLRNSDHIINLKLFFDSLINIQVYSSGSVFSRDTLFLKKLNISKQSNGDLSITLKSENVFIYSNEYGDALINGKIGNVSIRQQGVGMVDFSRCQIDSASIFTQGPGQIQIFSKYKIQGEIIRTGKVVLFGDPIEDILIKDQGKLIYGNP